MKIKRFEAPSMTDALRMIKKEFGEEAVILSAKNLKKPGRFLGGRSGQVVVTAAVDREASDASFSDGAEVSPTAGQDRTSIVRHAERSTEGIERILKHFTPITRTGRSKMQPKIVKLMNETTQLPDNAFPAAMGTSSIVDALVKQAMAKPLAIQLAEQMTQLLTDDQPHFEDTQAVLAHIIEAKGWIASQRSLYSSKPAVVVLVGPGGAGKTTIAAKIAAQEVLQGQLSVGIINLDTLRIAGVDTLQRYAALMQVPFATADNEQQFKACLTQMKALDLIVVDTPGLSANELHQRNQLKQLLSLLDAPSVHLVVNAAHCGEAVNNAISFFKPLGVNHLLPTHLDWYEKWGGVINQLNGHRLGVGFFSNGSRIPEDLGIISSSALAAILLGHGEKIDNTDDQSLTVVTKTPRNNRHEQYVANRNSDIFHLNTCKSVSRIHEDNILIFRDSDEAIEQGFKPCRMCCISLFVPKPIERPARRRVAGSRN